MTVDNQNVMYAPGCQLAAQRSRISLNEHKSDARVRYCSEAKHVDFLLYSDFEVGTQDAIVGKLFCLFESSFFL